MEIKETTSVICDLTELPQNIVARSEENKKDRTIIKWSGAFPIPSIGDNVTISFNGLGTDQILSYFIEHGFLGVYVKLDNPPAWHRQQHSPGSKFRGKALVFGNELA